MFRGKMNSTYASVELMTILERKKKLSGRPAAVNENKAKQSDSLITIDRGII